MRYRNYFNLTRPLISANWQFWVKSCNLFPLIISVTCNLRILYFPQIKHGP